MGGPPRGPPPRGPPPRGPPPRGPPPRGAPPQRPVLEITESSTPSTSWTLIDFPTGEDLLREAQAAKAAVRLLEDLRRAVLTQRLVKNCRGRFVTLPFPHRPSARRAARSPSERTAAPRRTPRTVFACVWKLTSKFGYSSEPQLKFYFRTGLLGARRPAALHLARRAERRREVRHLEVSARRRNSTSA